MTAPARIVLVIGLAGVLWSAVWVALAKETSGAHAAANARRGHSAIEGRVAIPEPLASLLERDAAPPLHVRIALPRRVVTADVDDNGRFVVGGLPSVPLDVEVRLGSERLALVEDVVPTAPPRHDGALPLIDARLAALELDGPVHAIELSVLDADHAPIDEGWLAWRPSGFDRFEALAPVREGRVLIATLSEIVDVYPLLAGYDAPMRRGLVGGERLIAGAGPSIEARAPEVPEGVALRLELIGCEPPAVLAGEARQSACIARGGWIEDGVARLALPGAGTQRVAWVAYWKHGEHLIRLGSLPARVHEVAVPARGTTAIDLPLDRAALDRALEWTIEQEGIRAR